MKVLSLVLVLTTASVASAGNDELWPILHDVLDAQRDKPCKELWTIPSEVVTYAMKIDAGRVLERANDRTSQRYGYDPQGRITSIAGKDSLLGDFTVAVRYGKRGIERLTQLRTPRAAGTRRAGSKFELIWRRPEKDLLRISVAIDGKEKATDVWRYRNGRLTAMELSSGETVTAGYDDEGRLAAMTGSFAGKTSSRKTYAYDASGRLVREEIDQDGDGTVDQKREYSYVCDTK